MKRKTMTLQDYEWGQRVSLITAVVVSIIVLAMIIGLGLKGTLP